MFRTVLSGRYGAVSEEPPRILAQCGRGAVTGVFATRPLCTDQVILSVSVVLPLHPNSFFQFAMQSASDPWLTRAAVANELTAPFSGVPSPSVTWNRAGVPSGSTLRITIRGMKGAWKDTSYNNIIKMYFSLKSDRPQTCTETLNFTVQVL